VQKAPSTSLIKISLPFDSECILHSWKFQAVKEHDLKVMIWAASRSGKNLKKIEHFLKFDNFRPLFPH